MKIDMDVDTHTDTQNTDTKIYMDIQRFRNRISVKSSDIKLSRVPLIMDIGLSAYPWTIVI
jgi:hypothetical protein